MGNFGKFWEIVCHPCRTQPIPVVSSAHNGPSTITGGVARRVHTARKWHAPPSENAGKTDEKILKSADFACADPCAPSAHGAQPPRRPVGVKIGGSMDYNVRFNPSGLALVVAATAGVCFIVFAFYSLGSFAYLSRL